jgi:hypothetical protein
MINVALTATLAQNKRSCCDCQCWDDKRSTAAERMQSAM